MTSVGTQYRTKRDAFEARHEAVFNAVAEGGVVDLDKLYTVARRTCGATRQETKTSIARLIEQKRIEVATPGTRQGKQATYRVRKEGES